MMVAHTSFTQAVTIPLHAACEVGLDSFSACFRPALVLCNTFEIGIFALWSG